MTDDLRLVRYQLSSGEARGEELRAPSACVGLGCIRDIRSRWADLGSDPCNFDRPSTGMVQKGAPEVECFKTLIMSSR